MKLQGIDHVEFYVSDPERSARALRDDFGFEIAGRRGTEAGQTGQAARAAQRSLLLRQGRMRLLLTRGLTPGHPAAEYVSRHGDGVAVVAFRTDDVQAAFEKAVAGGAAPITSPVFATVDGGRVGTAVVAGFGDVTHKLIERSGAADEFTHRAGGQNTPRPGRGDGLFLDIDHLAVCLPAGELAATVRLYSQAFGLCEIFDERIEVGGQAMTSKVVQDPSRHVTFTLIEPDLRRDPGQIDEFLQAHGGAGVQHLAFRTGDIARAVRVLAGRGVEFLSAPAGYFRLLEGRLGALAIPVPELQALNVLADRDRWGQMFQIFAASTHERRTFFFELIERQGALTFGSRNIKALYEALEVQHAAQTITSGQ